MTTKQEDRVTMYETVVRFLSPGGQGAALGQIKLIGLWRDKLDAKAKAIRAEEERQAQESTVVTRTRDEVKLQAASTGEVLRNLLLVLSEDDVLLAKLEAKATLEMSVGDDQLYRTYLHDIVKGIDALDAALLQDAGYDAKVRTTLVTDLAALDNTTGATRDLQIETEAATDLLPELFTEAATILEKKLDRLVAGQKKSETLADLVPQYETARRVVHTPAKKRKPTYRGATRYGAPVLALDRATLAGADLVLGNKSGKGVTLLYYVADRPDALPMAGQGVVVKRNAEVHLGPDTVQKLGEPGARYLLVIQQVMAGDGEFWVRG